jgi:uncharacterized protein YukE
MTAPSVASTLSGGATQYTIPVIVGDVSAAARLGAAYLELADAVDAASSQVGLVMAQLTATWQGVGSMGSTVPVEKIRRDTAALSSVLRTAGHDLTEYAGALEKAKEHHGFSLHKLIAVGAVVVVSVAAITVTVGAAAVVEAGAATALVAGATEAAGDATIADVAVSEELTSAISRVAALRPLLAFVVPHLAVAEWSAGSVAGYEELTDRRLDWRDIGIAGGLSFFGATVNDAVSSRLAATGWYAGAAPAARYATNALVEGTLWTGVAGLDDQIVEGHFDRADLVEALLITGGGTAAHDVLESSGLLFQRPDYRRAALIAGLHQPGRILDADLAHEMALLHQPIDEVVRGDIDLALHEGPGHTISRHVGRTTQQLMARIRRERLPRASTYWNEQVAQQAVNEAVRSRAAEIRAWLESGTERRFKFRYLGSDDVGFTISRRGRISLTRRVVVILENVNGHIQLVTSFPDPRP